MADELIIKIGAKVEDATKGIQEVKKQLENLNKTVTSKGAFASFIGNLGSSVTMRAFDLVKQGLSSVNEFMKDSIKAAADSEESLNKFNTSLALSGKYSKQASEDFQKFASTIQETTTFEDDAVLKSAALIQTMGNLSNDGLKKATTAAIELSSAIGVDLHTASMLMGKAATGNVEVFSRYGIVVKKTGNDAADFAAILNQISSQFGGSAASQLMTYQGAMTQLGNIFGNLQEEIGGLITQNPIVLSGISALKDMFISFTKIIINNKEIFNSLVGDAFGFFLKMIPTMISGIGFIIQGFYQLANGARAVKDIMLSVAESILSIANTIGKLYDKAKSLVGLRPSGTSSTATNIEAIGMVRAENDKAMLNSISTQEDISNKVKEFSLAAQKAVEDRVNKTIQVNTKEKDSFLANLSEKNKGHRVMTKSMAKTWEELQKIETEVQDSIAKRARNIWKPVEIDKSKLSKEQKGRFDIGQAVGVGVGALGGVLGGTEGARGLIVGAAKMGANMIMPGLGEAAGPILEALSQGPDAVKAMISEFVDAAPMFIENIILAIPALIEALAQKLPVLIKTLVDKAPDIIKKLVQEAPNVIKALVQMSPMIITSLVDMMPELAGSFMVALIKESPRLISAFASGMLQGVGRAFDSIVDWIKSLFGFGGGGGSQWYNPFSWADGGQGFVKQVPTGFMNDTYPARLTSGELIVDRSTAQDLKSFLNNEKKSDINTNLLIKILDALQSPINVSSNVELNRKSFAEIILELNRSNVRMA